jgi:hypothetical protein
VREALGEREDEVVERGVLVVHRPQVFAVHDPE